MPLKRLHSHSHSPLLLLFSLSLSSSSLSSNHRCSTLLNPYCRFCRRCRITWNSIHRFVSFCSVQLSWVEFSSMLIRVVHMYVRESWQTKRLQKSKIYRCYGSALLCSMCWLTMTIAMMVCWSRTHDIRSFSLHTHARSRTRYQRERNHTHIGRRYFRYLSVRQLFVCVWVSVLFFPSLSTYIYVLYRCRGRGCLKRFILCTYTH